MLKNQGRVIFVKNLAKFVKHLNGQTALPAQIMAAPSFSVSPRIPRYGETVEVKIADEIYQEYNIKNPQTNETLKSYAAFGSIHDDLSLILLGE